MTRIAEKGDAKAIASVVECLKDSVVDVRQTAIEVLLELAEKGDQSVVQGLSEILQDQEQVVPKCEKNKARCNAPLTAAQCTGKCASCEDEIKDKTIPMSKDPFGVPNGYPQPPDKEAKPTLAYVCVECKKYALCRRCYNFKNKGEKIGMKAAKALPKLVTNKEDLLPILSSINFAGCGAPALSNPPGKQALMT